MAAEEVMVPATSRFRSKIVMIAEKMGLPAAVDLLILSLEDPVSETGRYSLDYLSNDRKCRIEALVVADATIKELIIRDPKRGDHGFNAEITAEVLSNTIKRSPRLINHIQDKLCNLAFGESEPIRHRVIDVARVLMPSSFANSIKAYDGDAVLKTQIMRMLGGEEAIAFFTELQAQALAEYRAPLVELEKVALERWDALTKDANRSVTISRRMSIAVFIVGTLVVIIAFVLLVFSDNPWTQLASAIGAVGTFLALYSQRFWKEPIEQIQYFSIQQARLQTAFIGYMNRVSQLRLVFEHQYAEEKITVKQLQAYQDMLRDAIDQATQHFILKTEQPIEPKN